MFGQFSYLTSILIFAGLAILVVWISGFHLLKKFTKILPVPIIFMLLLTPIEWFALRWKIWSYIPESALNITFLGAELETFVFSLLVATAIASPVIVWSEFEEEGKSVFSESLKHLFRGTYAIWRKGK